MSFSPLSAATVDEVVARLGFVDRPAADLEGLQSVYSAWCRRVPFDNLRKLVALQYDMPEIPGVRPDDFFAAWLLLGAGATCWGSNNALHALLTGLGFEARLHAASMTDAEINHGTTIVDLGAERWLVDTAIHGDVPVALRSTVTTVEHAGYATTVRPDDNGWVIDCPTAEPGESMPCRIHHEIDHDFTLVANEKSRTSSPFNDQIRVEINDADGVSLLQGNRLVRIAATGTTARTLSDDEVDQWIADVAGHSPQLVTEVRAILDFRGETGAS